MSKVIKNPATLIKNIASKLYMGFEGEEYDPKKTIGSQLKDPGFLQRQFWIKFVDGINERFSGAAFDTQRLWTALLDQDIDPRHVEHMIQVKTYTKKESSTRMVKLVDPTADASQEGAPSPIQYIRQWDQILDRTHTFVAPYTIDPESVDNKNYSPEFRFLNLALQSDNAALFLYVSKHTDQYLQSWVSNLPNLDDRDKVSLAKMIVEVICSSGIKKPEQTVRAANFMGPMLSKVAKLLQSITFDRELEAGFVSNNLPAALSLHFPEKQERGEVAKELMAIGLPEITEGALESLFMQPEQAVEALSKIDHAAAFHAFGRELGAAIGVKDYHKIRDLPTLVSVVETYRELFLQYGMGDIKKHACLDSVCKTLESAEHFVANGYVRKNPSFYFNSYAIWKPKDYETCPFGSSFSRDGESQKPEKHEVDRILNVLVKLEAVDTLAPEIEKYFKSDGFPAALMEREVFEQLLVRVIERKLLDPNELLRTDTRLNKVQALGITPAALEGVKLFDRKVDAYLARDLGL